MQMLRAVATLPVVVGMSRQCRRRPTAWNPWPKGTALALFLLCSLVRAQGPVTFQYIYDDLNQLIKVIDSAGVVIQYVYDPVGNILQINRSTVTPGTLAIFNVTPSQAPSGTTVTIQGQGFSINPALNVVTIGGLTVMVVSATSTTLVVAVPAGAMSGSISVTVGGVTATSPNQEIVIPAPIITSVVPRVMQAGTNPSVTVRGANSANATFSIPRSGILVAGATPTTDGVSAVLTLLASANSIVSKQPNIHARNQPASTRTEMCHNLS